MKKLADTKLNEDIVVPLDRQVELVQFVRSLREKSKLKIGVFVIAGITMSISCTTKVMPKKRNALSEFC